MPNIKVTGIRLPCRYELKDYRRHLPKGEYFVTCQTEVVDGKRMCWQVSKTDERLVDLNTIALMKPILEIELEYGINEDLIEIESFRYRGIRWNVLNDRLAILHQNECYTLFDFNQNDYESSHTKIKLDQWFSGNPEYSIMFGRR